jgi:hypothetical protein
MSKEAMKLALEALELEEAQTHYPSQSTLKAIKALKEALAENSSVTKQEQGEPVGTVGELFDDRIIWKRELDRDLLVYTSLPQQRTWVGLTDEDDIDWEDGGNLKDLVKAIEAKLKEKNT